MSDRTRPLLVTHSGKFHCDEVFAYVALRLALGLDDPGQDGDHDLVRTRDAKVIAGADWAWDVGSLYDPAARRFDHHQRGAPVRPDGTPFSSAGLVWQAHGVAATRAVLTQSEKSGEAEFAPDIAADIEASVVRRIDEIDNGVALHVDELGLASMVGDCNPSWDAAPDGPAAHGTADAAFLQAAALVEGVLRRRIEQIRSRLASDAVVLAAHNGSADPRILEMERGMPWQRAVFAHDLPVIYAVYPVSNGNWMVDSMPPEPGSFEQRLPLPAAWAGLQDAALVEQTGVADAVFVHVRRFVGAAGSRAGAVELARKALAGA